MDNIRTTIINLLQIKKHISINDIYSIIKDDGYTKNDILQSILANKKLYLKLDDNGRIIKFDENAGFNLEKHKKYVAGMSYIVKEINYGCQKVMESNSAELNKYKESYWCGGLGDSYEVKEVLLNDKNIEIAKSLNMSEYNDGINITRYHYWVEIKPSKKLKNN